MQKSLHAAHVAADCQIRSGLAKRVGWWEIKIAAAVGRATVLDCAWRVAEREEGNDERTNGHVACGWRARAM